MQAVDAQFRVAVVNIAKRIIQVTQPVDFFIASRIVKAASGRMQPGYECRVLENTKLLCDFTAVDLGGEHRVIACQAGCCLQVDEVLSPPTPFGATTPTLQAMGIAVPQSTLKLMKLGMDGKVEVLHEAKVTSIAEAETIIREVSQKYSMPGPIVSPENPAPVSAPPPVTPARGPSPLTSAFKSWSLWRAFKQWFFRYRPRPELFLQTKDEESCHGK